MSDRNGANCGTCKFSGALAGGDGALSLVCKRKPPTVHAGFFGKGGELMCNAMTFWPSVKVEDWCGEHESQRLLQ